MSRFSLPASPSSLPHAGHTFRFYLGRGYADDSSIAAWVLGAIQKVLPGRWLGVGYTVLPGTGTWTSTGATETESMIVVEFVHAHGAFVFSPEEADALAHELGLTFGQREVLYTVTNLSAVRSVTT